MYRKLWWLLSDECIMCGLFHNLFDCHSSGLELLVKNFVILRNFVWISDQSALEIWLMWFSQQVFHSSYDVAPATAATKVVVSSHRKKTNNAENSKSNNQPPRHTDREGERGRVFATLSKTNWTKSIHPFKMRKYFVFAFIDSLSLSYFPFVDSLWMRLCVGLCAYMQ